MHVFVTSLGIISPIGKNATETLAALETSACGLTPLSLFSSSVEPPLPSGEVRSPLPDDVPRTHGLALIAAREAMANASGPPDAIVIGVTTGGMPASELFLKNNAPDPEKFHYHGTGTVAHCLAGALGCHGPVLTVSTACSSGMVALKIAAELLKSGKARRVLAGGADGLCRLTYYGFNSLQLVDPAGARPFDKDRRGMSVGEGSAMLVLEAATDPPEGALAEVLAVGLTCDAYHPAAPHPDGAGAAQAMRQALAGAGCAASDIDYINLHGTGTPDNDAAEARALQALFRTLPLPAASSIKGAAGHTLGAAGAINAAISVLSIAHGILPANTGCRQPDPGLQLIPLSSPCRRPVSTVLSNAFGFGGNNASILLCKPAATRMPVQTTSRSTAFAVLGSSCLTGAGDCAQTLAGLREGAGISGMAPARAIMAGLNESAVRRLKRLPRMALSLASAAHGSSGCAEPPASVFFGTGWGGLSETHDFLSQLFSTQERFTSPTDFIGSVHNAPAGQVALHFQAKGPNITLTDGDYSFEQALFSAGLITHEAPGTIMVIGADEYHEKLTPLFDASAAGASVSSDGGGALLLQPSDAPMGLRIAPLFVSNDPASDLTIKRLLAALGGSETISKKYGAVFAGIPGAQRDNGNKQLELFINAAGRDCPVIDYRAVTGEFASASAVAAVIAVDCVRQGELPAGLRRAAPGSLHGRGILLLGLGQCITAVEILG
jgi:3-oxoacyl-[acyl-carrier-protein] synthase-1/3-oxoacyl-[acyl-carrier-protein] synthase II